MVRPCFSKILSFWPLKGLPLRHPSAANLRRRASAAIYGFCPVNSPGASMKADVMPQRKGYETLMALTSSLITTANLFVGNRDPTHRHLRFSHTQLPVQNPQSRDADLGTTVQPEWQLNRCKAEEYTLRHKADSGNFGVETVTVLLRLWYVGLAPLCLPWLFFSGV